MGGKASIYIHLKPRGIGGILAIGEGEVTSDLMSFLAIQVQTWRKADFDNSYELPGHALKPVSSTRRYSKKEIPTGMISMAVPPDSLAMEIHFRQRECGFYPAEGVTDFSYSMALDQPGVAHRKIRLRPYAMDETPVTNEQFAKFVNATKYKPEFADNFLKDWENGNPSKGTENHPVTWIAMEDARAYARWAGKRLPTEEEWQWAAQSGDKGWLYPWGNEYDSMACNHGQTKTTSDVARFKNGRTAQGLYDLCGNVWQLTESERTDGQNTYCIVRGGSWYATHGSGWYADQGPLKTNFASKYLLTCPGLDRCATLGFRCVVDLR
jgi:iron(II)-dependent oxidoreductase